MTHATDELRLAKLLQSQEWRRRSNRAIANHLGVGTRAVKRVREELGLTPDVIERTDGRLTKIGNTGKQIGRVLTAEQQKLIAEMAPKAMKLASWRANKILDESELLSVAHEALIVAARYWRPMKQTGKELAPGSKWQAYATNGITLAFRRAFKNARKKLRRTAAWGRHPYQKWVMWQRMKLRMGPKPEREDDRRSDPVALEELPEAEDITIVDRYWTLLPIQRMILDRATGYDGQKPWPLDKIASHWQMDVAKVQETINEAKLALVG